MGGRRRAGGDGRLADLELWLSQRDVFTGAPGHILPLQRCVMALLGMAQEIGASGVSVAQLWRLVWRPPHVNTQLPENPD